MSKQISCGIIIDTPDGWLICHPTGQKEYWDLPKGKMEEGEVPLETALRELHEETGYILERGHSFVDLGLHPYNNTKNLHLFYTSIDDNIDVSKLFCSTYVEVKGKYKFPEMDRYDILPFEKCMDRFSPSMKKWMSKNFSYDKVKTNA